MTARGLYLAMLDRWAQLQVPYLWPTGAVDRNGTPFADPWPGKDLRGLDCSGAVSFAFWLATGQDKRLQWWTQWLWDNLEPVTSPELGDLALFGVAIDHVMTVADYNGQLVGACGGDHTCTSVAVSRSKGACVRYRPSIDYRPDFRGYRALPWGA